MVGTKQRAIILHGMPDQDEYLSGQEPSASNAHWLPWLQNQLLIHGYDAQTPEVVDAWRPDYDVWRAEFERHVVDKPMTLVGHSCGGGFLLRWLSEHADVRPTCVVLVAPWIDPFHADTTDFFDFELDPDLPKRVGALHLFHSNDDMNSVVTSVEKVTSALEGIRFHRYESMGHFCFGDMGTVEFPDLLQAIVGQ